MNIDLCHVEELYIALLAERAMDEYTQHREHSLDYYAVRDARIQHIRKAVPVLGDYTISVVDTSDTPFWAHTPTFTTRHMNISGAKKAIKDAIDDALMTFESTLCHKCGTDMRSPRYEFTTDTGYRYAEYICKTCDAHRHIIHDPDGSATVDVYHSDYRPHPCPYCDTDMGVPETWTDDQGYSASTYSCHNCGASQRVTNYPSAD